MEFNSAPADPCSNTRRDNVWSEATSSESVETLLKSVGQEEMMPAASIIPGTSVCKDQSGSARHVESDIDLDTRNSDNMGPKNEFHEDPSQNKPLDKQLPLVEVSALNSENAGLSFENPHNLTHNTVSATSFISANEGEHDTEPADENVQEPKTTGCSKLVVLGASEVLATSSDIGSTLDGIHDGSADGSNQHSAELGYFSEPEEVICGSSEQDGKLPVCTGNLDPENVKTPTTHLETQSVGEEEVIKGNDGLHNLQGQTSDGMETGTSASSNPAAFTHTQLVQFRAQIDVWVSLCQGTVPDLDSMVLAVGPSDAGEIARPSLWATALERVAATDVAAMEVAATEEEARWAGIEYIDQKREGERAWIKSKMKIDPYSEPEPTDASPLGTSGTTSLGSGSTPTSLGGGIEEKKEKS